MLSIVRACAVVGLDGYIVEVETDFNPRAHIPSFIIVGSPNGHTSAAKSGQIAAPEYPIRSRNLPATRARTD